VRLFPDLATRWNAHHHKLTIRAGEQDASEILIRLGIDDDVSVIAHGFRGLNVGKRDRFRLQTLRKENKNYGDCNAANNG
jgi:hypothetical protein